MAYSTAYTSNFYNIYGTYVEVDIRKNNFVGSPVALRSTEVSIEFNFQDNNTPVCGTGAKIVIVNQGESLVEWNELDVLLTSKEKEYWCIIKYNGQTVFNGFSVCELNEQQFNYYSRIVLQFTDYLSRLKEYYMPALPIGSSIDLMTIVRSLTHAVGFGITMGDLYVNSTLFEANMDRDPTDTYVMQTFMESNMFYKDNLNYDDAVTMANRALVSFGAFLYSYGDKWVLENQEDMIRGGGAMDPWVKYTFFNVASEVSSLKQELNRQAGDFVYIDESQILAYDTGLQKLILQLRDKSLDSYVFNDWTTTMLFNAYFPDIGPAAGSIGFRQWYKYTGMEILEVGSAFRDMEKYVKYNCPTSVFPGSGDHRHAALSYAFEIDFSDDPDNPSVLNINFSRTTDITMTPDSPAIAIFSYFSIRIDNGTHAGDWLHEIPGPTGAPMLVVDNIIPDSGLGGFLFKDVIKMQDNSERLWRISRSFDLTTLQHVPQPSPHPDAPFPSIWEQLGKPTKQRFIINFYPTVQTALNVHRINYLGDIQISLSNQKILNKLTYYINADFVKTEEIDIDFWDAPSANFANGISWGVGGMGGGPEGKTTAWQTQTVTPEQPLMDIFAKNKFRNYSKTIYRLNGTIMADRYIKPFATLTDDNRPGIQFVVHGYTWDLNNGSYEIEAEEYTTEDIVLDTDVVPDPGVPPTIPVNLDGSQGTPGDGFDLTWEASTGAAPITYTVQRQGYWDGTAWVMAWKTIYQGPNLSTYDDLDMIGLGAVPSNGQSFFYQIKASNPTTTSLYSSALHLFYMLF